MMRSMSDGVAQRRAFDYGHDSLCSNQFKHGEGLHLKKQRLNLKDHIYRIATS